MKNMKNKDIVLLTISSFILGLIVGLFVLIYK